MAYYNYAFITIASLHAIPALKLTAGVTFKLNRKSIHALNTLGYDDQWQKLVNRVFSFSVSRGTSLGVFLFAPARPFKKVNSMVELPSRSETYEGIVKKQLVAGTENRMAHTGSEAQYYLLSYRYTLLYNTQYTESSRYQVMPSN